MEELKKILDEWYLEFHGIEKFPEWVFDQVIEVLEKIQNDKCKSCNITTTHNAIYTSWGD